jgi:heme exporter protein CcmD
MAELLDMGEFAAFVWPCYASTAIGMIWLTLSSWMRARRAAKKLSELSSGASPD